MAFGVAGLQCGGRDAGFVGDVGQDLAGAYDVWIVAIGVYHFSFADYVVDDNDRAGMGKF